MGSKEDRKVFVEMVRKSCRFGKKLRELGVRPNGLVRIDSASKPDAWTKILPATQNSLLKHSAKLAMWLLITEKNWLLKEKSVGWDA